MKEQQNLTAYVDRLYSLAVKKTGDPHVAEDLAQETFLAAIRVLSHGNPPGDLWPWLCRVLSNKYCDWLREKYNKPSISFEEYPFDIPEEVQTDDATEEQLEAIRRELGYLSRTHREVMVRFYMGGDTLEQIASDLSLPVGTVKSRLHTGRQHIRKGVNEMKETTNMEPYTKQSYEPDLLHIGFSGNDGLHGEPFSLVDPADKLTQNILILAYEQPVTETEIAKALGVPAAFVEPVVQKMIDGELMRRTDGGKVYTDFILYTEQDRNATFQKQMDTVEQHFDLFWSQTEKALAELRQKDYYQCQTISAKAKLELHFCIKLLMNAMVTVRNEVTGHMPFSEYPYRKNGGRWFALGHHYAADRDAQRDMRIWNYSVSGEAGFEVKNFRDAKYLELRKFDTALGAFPNQYFHGEYSKWFYELLTKVPYEESAVGDHVLQSAEALMEQGILVKEDALQLNLPVLTEQEYHDESNLISKWEEAVSQDIHDVVLPVFETGYVKLPPHLKSVPKWQQYLHCGNSIFMAVIYKAREKGLFLAGVNEPLPAAILVVEKG